MVRICHSSEGTILPLIGMNNTTPKPHEGKSSCEAHLIPSFKILQSFPCSHFTVSSANCLLPGKQTGYDLLKFCKSKGKGGKLANLFSGLEFGAILSRISCSSILPIFPSKIKRSFFHQTRPHESNVPKALGAPCVNCLLHQELVLLFHLR